MFYIFRFKLSLTNILNSIDIVFKIEITDYTFWFFMEQYFPDIM